MSYIHFLFNDLFGWALEVGQILLRCAWAPGPSKSLKCFNYATG